MTTVEQKKGLPWWMWAALIVLVLAIAIVGVTELFKVIGVGQSGRPIKQLVDEVDCDRLDLGDGSVKFFCNDGTIWTGVPFELGEKAQ